MLHDERARHRDRDRRRAVAAAPHPRGVDPGRRARGSEHPARVRGALVRAARADRRGRGDRDGVGVGPARVRQPPATRRRRRGARSRLRALRDALPARVGVRRAAGRRLPGRRAVGHLPRGARAAVRRPVVRRRRAAPGSRRSSSRRRDVVGATAGATRTGAAKIARRPRTRPSRTGGCRSRSDRSPTTSCRPCSRSTGAASAWRPARPIGPTAGCAPSSTARSARSRTARWSAARRAYTFELTMPGGACVPVAGVSSVAVQPTHRRRGVLTSMIGALHDDARARGEVAVGADRVGEHHLQALRLRRGHVAARLLDRLAATRVWRARSPTPDRVRLVQRGEADLIYRDVYERVRRRAGPAWSRGPTSGGPRCSGWPRAGRALFDAVHEDANGRADGYVSYEIKGEWYGGFADRELFVWDLQAAESGRARRAVGVRVRCRPRREDHRDESSRRRAAAVHARRSAPAAHRVLQRFAVGVAARRRRAARGAYVLDRRARLTIEVVDPDGSRSQFVARRRARRRDCAARSPSAAPDLTCSRVDARRAAARRQLVGDARRGRRRRRARAGRGSPGPTRCSRRRPPRRR